MSLRLSVIVPFYNETAFLRMAVWSVLAQGLDRIEVIVVNDNPEAFCEADIRALGLPPQVRVLSHDRNRGLSAARNTAIAASEAAMVGFLDADDYYTSGGLARQLAFAESSRADLTHGMAYLTRGGSPTVQVLARDAALHGQEKVINGGLHRLEEAQFIVSSWSSLYSRAFLDRADLRFDEAQTTFEDRIFVLQTVSAAQRIAMLGAPVRVWRRRAESISTTAANPATHRLQVQLLEKCMAHMRAQAAGGLPQRFLKREVFNTVSRLIWDMDLLDAVLRGEDPVYAEFAARIPAILGSERFHADFFSDPVVSRISRIGQPSRRGIVPRATFFALHAALRTGDFPALRQLLPERMPDADTAAAKVERAAAQARAARAKVRPQRSSADLILHLGMHKTGSTYLQGQLRAHAARLARLGILVPETGQDRPDRPVTRPGGFAGHTGLLAALNEGNPKPWADLMTEVKASRARRVILSCENMLMPLEVDRDGRIADLFDHLRCFNSVQVVAMVRRPDRAIEAFWREMVGNGRRAGARSAAEFAVDNAASLTDLPALFAPFERGSLRPVRLADHDALRHGLWPAFLGLCGLSGSEVAGLPEIPGLPRYPTPHSAQISVARLVDAMISAPETRTEILQTLFRLPCPACEDRPFLSPAERGALIDRFAARSVEWTASRGYAPDMSGWRAELAAEAWQPPAAPDPVLLEQLVAARLFAERPGGKPAPGPRSSPKAPVVSVPAEPRSLTLRIRPRPWLRRLLARIGPARPGA